MRGAIDLVIAGDGSAARAAAVSALQRGEHVLVVLRSTDAQAARSLRRTLLKTADVGGQLRVMTGAEVVCVDGVDGVEAVVVRHAPTGHLSAVNASAFVSFDASSRSRCPPGPDEDEPRPVEDKSRLLSQLLNGIPVQIARAGARAVCRLARSPSEVARRGARHPEHQATTLRSIPRAFAAATGSLSMGCGTFFPGIDSDLADEVAERPVLIQ
jgi:hypothetical protein